MATNRDIVATRKLNKENKARLGRGGDTKIREVGGRDSHVNALEAYLIDVNGKAGEEYAKRVGSGTTNPLTGMPEYHMPETEKQGVNRIWLAHDDTKHKHEGAPSAGEIFDDGGTWDSQAKWSSTATGTLPIDKWTAPEGRQTYETLSGYDPEQLEKYLQSEFDMADDSMQYIEGFKEEPFGFLGEGKALSEKGLESAYGTTMGTLGRTAGRGFREAGKGRDIAASRSGLATSGTITQAYETQKKDLFQDYRAGMGDIRQERGTALGALTLGKDVAGYDYDYTVAGASLDFDKNTFSEQQRQLDEYWEMIGLRQSVG